MPRQSGLLYRKGRFYLNMRVPTELRPLYGKTEFIRKALGTSDYREAVREVRYRAFEMEAEFDERRRILHSTRNGAETEKLGELSDREAHNLVFRFLIDRERLSEEWWDRDGSTLDGEDKEEVLDILRTDEVVYSGGSKHYYPEDGSGDLDAFLKAEGLECPKDSPAYEKLRPLFRKARLENVRRTIDRVTHQTITPREPLFRDVFAHTPAKPARPIVTLGEMLNRFTKALTDAKRTEGTHRTYEVPCRLLRERIGENTPLDAIKREDIEGLFDLLRRAPSNATKRYPGRTLEQAIAEADKRGDTNRLGAKTLAHYFNNIVALFNFAVEKRIMAENPARDRWLRASFADDRAERQKAHFSVEELNKLFRAPLYFGDVAVLSGREGRQFEVEVTGLEVGHPPEVVEVAETSGQPFC